MKVNVVRRLTESAIMLAAATVLSIIPLVEMPLGGKLTPISMLPILLIAYRYKPGWGFLVSFTYGLIQMILGLKNLSYGTSAWAVICIILFDYLVAYGVLGFGGIFRGKLNNRAVEFTLGSAIGCVLRFLCHFVTGIAIWGQWNETGLPTWVYSIAYNGAYMLPELVLTLIVGAILCSIFDFTSPDLKRIRRASNK